MNKKGFVWFPVIVMVALVGLMISTVKYVTDPNVSFDIRNWASLEHCPDLDETTCKSDDSCNWKSTETINCSDFSNSESECSQKTGCTFLPSVSSNDPHAKDLSSVCKGKTYSIGYCEEKKGTTTETTELYCREDKEEECNRNGVNCIKDANGGYCEEVKQDCVPGKLECVGSHATKYCKTDGTWSGITSCGVKICTDGKCQRLVEEEKKDNNERCSEDKECKSGNCATVPGGKYCAAPGVGASLIVNPTANGMKRCGSMNRSVEEMKNGEWVEIQQCVSYCDDTTHACVDQNYDSVSALDIDPDDNLSLTQDPLMAGTMESVYNDSINQCVQAGNSLSQCQSIVQSRFNQGAETGDTCITLYLMENPNRSVEDAKSQCDLERSNAVILATSFTPVAGARYMVSGYNALESTAMAVSECDSLSDIKDKQACRMSIFNAGLALGDFGALTTGSRFASGLIEAGEVVQGTSMAASSCRQAFQNDEQGYEQCIAQAVMTIASAVAGADDIAYTGRQIGGYVQGIVDSQLSRLYDLYDYDSQASFKRYLERYGEVPERMWLGADIDELYPFQKDIIAAGQGSKINLQKMLDQLEAQGVNVHVYKLEELAYANRLSEQYERSVLRGVDPGFQKREIPLLVQEAIDSGRQLPSGYSQSCPIGWCSSVSGSERTFIEKLTGRKPSDIFLTNPKEYSEMYGLTGGSEESRKLFLQKLGHEAGHALDWSVLGLDDMWSSEVRQKYFNSMYYEAIGDYATAAGYRDFVRLALDRTIPLIKVNSPNMGRGYQTTIWHDQ